MIQNREEICPNCGKGFLITDKIRGETVCKKCGIVVEQNIIDSRAEWRSFSPEEYKKRTRVGAKTRLDKFDKGLTTVIAKENKDGFGISLTPNMRTNIYRLRKWQERTKTAKAIDRNLNIAMIELDQIAFQLNLSKDLRESAAYIYRKTLSKGKGLAKGRTIKGIITASISYCNCSENTACTIEVLVDEGRYPNRSEAIRTAVRDFIKEEFSQNWIKKEKVHLLLL